MLWPIDLHFMYEFFLPTMSLKNISAHSTIEKSLYLISLPYLHITTLTLSCLSSSSKLRKKSPTKPSQSNSFSFSSMSLSKFFVFLEQNNSRKIKNFFFYFHSHSPLFSAYIRENINEKNKKLTPHDKKEKAQISFE